MAEAGALPPAGDRGRGPGESQATKGAGALRPGAVHRLRDPGLRHRGRLGAGRRAGDHLAADLAGDLPDPVRDAHGRARLRQKYPDTRRPYRVPGGMAGAWAAAVITELFVVITAVTLLWPGAINGLFGQSYSVEASWGVSRAFFEWVTLGVRGHGPARGRVLGHRRPERPARAARARQGGTGRVLVGRGAGPGSRAGSRGSRLGRERVAGGQHDSYVTVTGR